MIKTITLFALILLSSMGALLAQVNDSKTSATKRDSISVETIEVRKRNSPANNKTIPSKDSTYLIQLVGKETPPAYQKMPEYPGGDVALLEFINRNFNYPMDALDKEIQGKIIVQYFVEEDGSVSNVSIKQRIANNDYGLNKEAIRVVKLLGKFKPGMVNGKPTRTQLEVPINFHNQ